MENSAETGAHVELWGGLECTINRVYDRFFDQLEFSGHYQREDDIELFAELGIKKIRYPILWEKHLPQLDKTIDWRNAEKRLKQLAELGIEPIAGLVHHGSGPAYAPIDSPQFSAELARYAALVAEKFPHINYYTPINEPLTTARFCGLYGIWHPHLTGTASFFRLLINECKATVLAMRAIRTINPEAKLIQTEDLSKTYSTPLLRSQAAFENKRRWLGFDLISGRVVPGHGLWDYLMSIGIMPSELEFLAANPCPPDVLGFNYYLTSERYLDERIESFPPESHGGNADFRYADVEAVRVKLEEETGPALLLREAWERFKLPIAITEVHLGCTREEQLRWFAELFKTVSELKTFGIDIKAVTAWALLGSHGWSELLQNPPGSYEPGIFDIRGGRPRPTALTRLIRSYANGTPFSHPVMEGKGWWKRDIRVLYFSHSLSRKISNEAQSSQPLLIAGKNGTLGRAFGRICDTRGIRYELLAREQLDICNISHIERVILEKRPWAIINAAGYVRVDEAEAEAEDCFLANATGPANLAALCRKYGVKLLTFSSDLVFDGQKTSHYLESDRVSPLNIYGQSKAKAEKLVLENDPSALVIRTSAFFGPWDEYNFVHNVLASLKNTSPFSAAHDIYISPTYVPDLVNISLDLLIDNEAGVWHLANEGEISWAALAAEVGSRAGLNKDLIRPVPAAELGFVAKRPSYTVLNSERGCLLPSLENALKRYFKEQELLLL